jgi:hypothetical protein
MAGIDQCSELAVNIKAKMYRRTPENPDMSRLVRKHRLINIDLDYVYLDIDGLRLEIVLS